MNKDLVPMNCWGCACGDSGRAEEPVATKCSDCNRWTQPCEHLEGDRQCRLLAAAASDPLSRQSFLQQRCRPVDLILRLAESRRRVDPSLDSRDLANEYIMTFLSRNQELFPELSSDKRGGFRGWVTIGIKNAERTIVRRERLPLMGEDREMVVVESNTRVEPRIESYLKQMRRQTPVEYLIIMGWAQGSTDQEIGDAVGLARETVNRKRRRILKRIALQTLGKEQR